MVQEDQKRLEIRMVKRTAALHGRLALAGPREEFECHGKSAV
jgi:hypothetical protein